MSGGGAVPRAARVRFKPRAAAAFGAGYTVNGRTGNPCVVNLHKIASALNMTLAEFLDFKELNAFSFDDNEEEYLAY